MTPAAFIREVKSESRKPLYVLCGGEPSATARCLAAAEEAVEAAFKDFNHQILSLEAEQAARLTAEAKTMAFYAPPRIIICKNPPFNADSWNVLADYLDDPNPGSTIILALDKIDARLKFFKKVKAAEAEVDCAPPKGAALARWLVAELAARGIKADDRSCALIIERAGSDLNVLLGEAEKLSLYLGDGGTLSSGLVGQMVSISPNADIFQLGEALGKRDLRAALSTLMELMATEHHLPVLAMMVRHFRLMLLIKTRQAQLGVRTLDQSEAPGLGMHPFALKKTQNQAADWNWRDLSQALKALEDAHRTLVTTATPPQMVLENLALSLAAKGNRPPSSGR